MAEARGDDGHVVDVKALFRGLKGKLSGDLVLSPLCSIFKIPTILSRHNREAFTPNAFSFGPFHRHDKNLEPTEKIKYKYLLDLISRRSNPNYNRNPIDGDTMLRTFTTEINKVRKEARAHYAGPVDMKDDEFVELLVLDGCFIIELFRKKAYESLREENDPIFAMSCLLQFLWHDLILLENQIPWLVLDTLFNWSCTSIDQKSLVQLAVEFFDNIFSTKPTPFQPLLSHPNKHILDLLRNSLLRNSSLFKKRITNSEAAITCELKPMHSARSLEESGIKFEMISSESILDIDFNKNEGVLKIPQLFIQETTETVFRNLISLEQCCLNYEPIFTSYAILLDNLISTKDDMEMLRKSKAIDSWLNIDDATKLFNKLYIDTFVKDSYYSCLTYEVDKYCKRFWPRQRRVLKRDYFKHPWALISVIAASIGLILTFLQTLFGIIK